MRRRLLSILAAAALSPVFIVPSTTGTATVAPEAVTTKDRQVALLPAAAPAVGDGDLASRRDLRLAKGQASSAGIAVAVPRVLEVTAPTAVPSDVAVVGVTWLQGTGSRIVVQYRTRARSTWGAWSAVDVDTTKGGDPAGAGTRAGSDPIVLTGAAFVQVRVLGPAGSAPARAALTVIDPGTSAADAAPGRSAAGAAVAALATPRTYSRAEWGARESLRRDGPSYGRVDGFVVHHTAGSNRYTPSQVPKILRGIYAFHVKGRGWNDIGYNVLIDKWGRIWEGRAGGLTAAVSGAHTQGFNPYTMGVSVMGDYGTARPTRAALTSLARVIGWKSAVHRTPVMGRVTILKKRYPRVMGHRDANRTSCPGRYLAAALPSIRRSAAGYATTYLRTLPPPAPMPAPAPGPAPVPIVR